MKLQYGSIRTEPVNKNPRGRIGQFTRAFMLGTTLASAMGCGFGTSSSETDIIRKFVEPNIISVGSPFVTVTMVNQETRQVVAIHGGQITKIDSEGIEFDSQTFGGGEIKRVKFGELKVDGSMRILVERGDTSDTAKVYVVTD